MIVDNHELIASLIDAKHDGDTFWYTELLDRSTNGSSRFKMLRAFRHNDRAEFLEQWPTIRHLCDQNQVRAYTRLTPRSHKQVAHHMLRAVTDQVLDGHYDALWHIYGSSCGKTSIHSRKLWLFDVDKPNEYTDSTIYHLDDLSLLKAVVPSRKGYHIITKGFHIDETLDGSWSCHMSLHKDNPTNLYIPENAP